MPLVPFLPSPLGDFGWTLAAGRLVVDPDSLCTKLHLKYIDCLEAYGARKGREVCAEVFYDMCECHTSNFQRMRARAIRNERMKQYREGKIKQPFAEHPPLDSYLYLV